MIAQPSIRLATWTAQACKILVRDRWRVCGSDVLPSVLFSYARRLVWTKHIDHMKMRNFVLDSGAFSAHSSGKPIKVTDFRDAIYRYRDENINPVEIFSLDVIGDAQGSLRNTEYLWSEGIRVIPVFHYGEDEDLLMGYARDYPKIALGGAVGLIRKEKERWTNQCFARVWPKPIHGLGYGVWACEAFPFHTIDCADWEARCSRWGSWESYGGRNLGLRKEDGYGNMASEAQYWLEHESKAQRRWKQTFDTLRWDDDAFMPFPRVTT